MRNYLDILTGWQFTKEGRKESVTLPHTWNAVDGQDGGNDYYRGQCLYERVLKAEELTPAEAEGRVYIEFDGVAMSAEVLVDQTVIGTHDGGYSRFRFDLTAFADGKDHTLGVKVSNESNDRVYPQKADFTFYGGIYRAVRLVKVPRVHFSLNYMGTSGLRITPVVDLEKKTAEVTVTAYVENKADDPETVVFETAGKKLEVPVTGSYATAKFLLDPVRLWDGLDDPFLYDMKATLSSGDAISSHYGCRSYEINGKGFFLNGRPYPLRGVSRHQDRKGLGNALTMKEHREDMDMIREIGANTIRLAHYQHAQEFYDLCDEIGMITWAEIPYITMHMPGGLENTLSQMEELIVQNYNHPSIVVWGLSNEITAASPVDDSLLNNHRLLNGLCHRLDPTRPTTMANVFMLEIESPILEIPDVNSYNLYFGWYLGELSQNDEFFDEYHEKYPERAIGFSEYGADTNPAFHSSTPEKGDYTEEYECLYHEHILRMIEERPWLWATHAWNMFDFAADGRDEGGKHGENQKGLVTFDRKIKKDAFYLYKAYWNKGDTFVHLCGRRYVDRAEKETLIKVYSNSGQVRLFVDGKLFEEQTGSRIFCFKVPISGEHEIEASVTTHEGHILTDMMNIRRTEEENPDYIYNKASKVVNWFDAGDLDPNAFSVQDTLGEIEAHPKAGAILKAMMDRAVASRGDVAESVKDNPALKKMMAKMTLISLLKQAGADEQAIKGLNRVLQGIKKQ